jgi:hypothetical protein
MSGEKIGEGNGHRGIRKVVATQPNFKVEVSFEETSKLMGVEGMNMGTYTAITKPDGSLEGVGEGVFATLEGEFVTWRGMGVGRFVEAGGVHYTGMLSYSTTSAKLTKLNSIAAMFEFEVDAAGKTHSQVYDTSAKAAHA